MASFGVSAQDIRDALQVSNAAQPSGTLVSGKRLRLDGSGARFGAWEFRELEGFSAPFHVYRR